MINSSGAGLISICIAVWRFAISYMLEKISKELTKIRELMERNNKE